MPDSEVELALVGRSNVGKSSLLNALANRRKLAHTSKAPGATRLLNLYELDPEGSGRWLVDLPGYGYAKVGKAEQQRWQKMIEGYLTERSQLIAAVVLIDGAIGPTPLDMQTIEWLDHIGLPQRFVATKVDKVKASKSRARRRELIAALGVAASEVRWVSATTGAGIPELRGDIAKAFDDEA